MLLERLRAPLAGQQHTGRGQADEEQDDDDDDDRGGFHRTPLWVIRVALDRVNRWQQVPEGRRPETSRTRPELRTRSVTSR